MTFNVIPADRLDGSGYAYVINIGDGRVKVGRTHKPYARMLSLRLDHGMPTEIWFSEPHLNYPATEDELVRVINGASASSGKSEVGYFDFNDITRRAISYVEAHGVMKEPKRSNLVSSKRMADESGRQHFHILRAIRMAFGRCQIDESKYVRVAVGGNGEPRPYMMVPPDIAKDIMSTPSRRTLPPLPFQRQK